MIERFPRIASLKTAAGLRARLGALGLDLPCDDDVLNGDCSPLGAPLRVDDTRPLSNRFVIQPMEGWDGTADGLPTELTRRRWQRFGASGAAWMWGGEALAVRADGRANPNQLMLTERTARSIGMLRRELLDAARAIGSEPLVGAQLTHSGRWSRPDANRRAPRVAFRHPLLDARSGVTDDRAVLSDREVDDVVACFAGAAHLAREEGFDFVDVKHCHGYLAHEFLAARSRLGKYGGASLAARSRLLHALVDAVRAAAPGLAIGVRLSVFDLVPYRRGPDADVGVPESHDVPYEHGFGLDPAAPAETDLREAIALARVLLELNVRWLNVTAGSPYYTPHIQRPAAFPPSDGYMPPEDPLVGVARLLAAARDIKAAVPQMIVVSSGWSYLQEFIPHVAQACLRAGWFDAVGLGRMVLTYPDLPRDVLAGTPLDRRRICRTFSDCTTAPRNGLVSGCYPLDPFYRERPERAQLDRIKRTSPPSGAQ
jgi:2,4-dienoyl-CoA reductase-like NADH-dependent reductase (Old Yellow Enzyme family)